MNVEKLQKEFDAWLENKEKAQTNARLIAVAPELYEQARLFENLLEVLQKEKSEHELCADYGLGSHSQVNEKLAQVREVLAKVDGRGEG